MGVTTIALIDTDSDPDLVDLPIPGNDDAMRAIEMIMAELADAIIEAKQGQGHAKGDDQVAPNAPRGARRSSRSQFSAAGAAREGAPVAAGTDAPAEAAPQGEPVAAGEVA